MGKVQSKVLHRKVKSSGSQKDENTNKKENSYVLPVDNDEIDRLTVQHYVFQHIWGDNFSSPVNNLLESGAKVLDVGCGPGVWILEMADRYRNSHFTGLDIVPNFPQTIKPENTVFLIGDVKRLPFEDNTFDFVYMRLMMFALVIEEWPDAIKELIRVCKPNGWIEIMERDIFWHNEPEMVHEWRTKIVDGMRETKGIELVITPHVPGFLQSNDRLTNIESDKRTANIGWGGKIYEDYRKVIQWGAKNLSPAISEIQFDKSQYESLIEVAIEELAKNKGYDISQRFWAQKKSL